MKLTITKKRSDFNDLSQQINIFNHNFQINFQNKQVNINTYINMQLNKYIKLSDLLNFYSVCLVKVIENVRLEPKNR